MIATVAAPSDSTPAFAAWRRRTHGALRIILASGLCAWTALLCAAPPRPAAHSSAATRVVVIGDSLSAEYGLPRGRGWVSIFRRQLQATAPQAEVINASISGDTTAGGAQRLPRLLELHHPTMVLIELGANDALRGLALQQTEKNLDQMVQACADSSAQVVVIGMRVPPNYGQRYTQDFASMFPRVAKRHRAALVPFLLEGVADDTDAMRWFQADGLHPIEAAQPTLANNVWRVVGPLLHLKPPKH